MELWQGIIIACITVVGSVVAARSSARSSVKVKEMDVTAQAYTQAEGITKGLIDTLREELKAMKEQRTADRNEHKEELAKRDVRLDAIEKEVSEVKDHNNALITFIYLLIALARKYGYQDEIPTPAPKGIHL